MAKSKVIAAANQKGGVGKRTSVFNLGVGLTAQAKRVLLLDVDPQVAISPKCWANVSPMT